MFVPLTEHSIWVWLLLRMFFSKNAGMWTMAEIRPSRMSRWASSMLCTS